MGKSINKFVLMIVLITSIGFLTAATIKNDLNNKLSEWVAPKSANNIKNPLAGNVKAALEGKKLFKQMCAICHGNKGKGDGMAGMALKPKPTDFTLKKVQSQADGAIFWKLTEGRAPMASYKKTLAETRRWQLVNYIRTLKR